VISGTTIWGYLNSHKKNHGIYDLLWGEKHGSNPYPAAFHGSKQRKRAANSVTEDQLRISLWEINTEENGTTN
jgi:hypothetical protein